MTPICAVLFAGICVSPTYAPATTKQAMFVSHQTYQAKKAESLGVEILIDSSDELIPTASATMNKLCRLHSCVLYRRHCDKKIFSCSFVYSGASDDKGYFYRTTSLDIRANSKASLSRALENVWVVLGAGREKFYISIARLDAESSTTSPLDCSNDTWIQGCQPSRRFRAIRPSHS